MIRKALGMFAVTVVATATAAVAQPAAVDLGTVLDISANYQIPDLSFGVSGFPDARISSIELNVLRLKL